MKPFKALISFEEARRIINENIKPVRKTENIGINSASGRVVAQDIFAQFDIPLFNRAAMDGYAVRAKDTFGATQFKPKFLKVISSISAGEITDKKLCKRGCIEIATGAKIPAGCDAVVIAENTESHQNKIKIFKPVYPKENISFQSEDIRKGTLIVRKNTFLAPSKIGAIASQGNERINVYSKPKIAVIPTGKEVCAVGKKLTRGQVYDINTYTVSAVIEDNGATAVKFDIVPDNYDDIVSAVKSAKNFDMLIFSGGSSVGARDMLADVVQELGEIKFHGVQIKPGKPTLFGSVTNKKIPVFGMPGYPTSCLLNTYLFIVLAVRKLAYMPEKEQKTVKARLGTRVHGSMGRRFFLTVKLEKGTAVPVFKESGAITSMSEADGYIEIPENVDVLEKGTEIEVILF